MKDTVLAVKWSKKENDFMIHYPRKCDGHLASYWVLSDVLKYDFRKWVDTKYDPVPAPPYEVYNFIKDLESRGYDIKTLKFSIELKKENEIRDSKENPI